MSCVPFFPQESGHIYFRARMMEPTTGEFASQDPLGYVDGMSLYRGYFVQETVDPLGLVTSKLSWPRYSYRQVNSIQDYPETDRNGVWDTTLSVAASFSGQSSDGQVFDPLEPSGTISFNVTGDGIKYVDTDSGIAGHAGWKKPLDELTLHNLGKKGEGVVLSVSQLMGP